jgi:tRNA 2-thiouridine synthesizing protein A
MAEKESAKPPDKVLDCVGLYCPMPVIKTKEEMDKLAVGQVLEVMADDPAAEEDLKAWAKRTGQKMLEISRTDQGLRFLIKKIK